MYSRMPNHCCNTVRLSGKEETIKTLLDAEFSFKLLHPMPELPPLEDPNQVDDRWYDWNCEHWGTKWDRYDYNVVKKGPYALEMVFTTAWAPPYRFFEHLLKIYKDLWIKCDWSEEGGGAGVFVGYTNPNTEELIVKELSWDDWCLEEYYHNFKDTKQNN